MTFNEHTPTHLRSDDQHLVDLLATVLMDPNLHTDTRMRLHREIAEILHAAHEDLHGRGGHEAHQRALEKHSGRLPDVLTSVLVDPNLHTDTRMRLHREIAEILATVIERPDDGTRA